MKTTPLGPEIIVQKQVEAYNNRDIGTFMSFFSNNVSVFQFPEKVLIHDKTSMINHYRTMFNTTPDLHCEITNRIVQGQTVIDKEHVLKNGEYIQAVAIYEVVDSLIERVTFILS